MCAECENNEISNDDLEEVSGGIDPGYDNPVVSGCWFHAYGPIERRNGALRRRCNQFACKAIPWESRLWHVCKCHGTDRCVNNWHSADSCQ